MKRIVVFSLTIIFITAFAIGALAGPRIPEVDCDEDPDDPRCNKQELEPKPGGSDSIRIIIINGKAYECLQTADGPVDCRPAAR